MVGRMRRSALIAALLLSACAAPQPQAPQPFPNLYQGSGFAVSYPLGWAVREDAVFTLGERVLRGTTFVFPAEQTRSALVGAEVFVAREPACPPQPYAQTIRRADAVWLRDAWTDADAGNRYDVTLSTAEPGEGCIVVTTLLHSCALGDACAPGHSAPFDRAAVQSMLDAVGMTARAT